MATSVPILQGSPNTGSLMQWTIIRPGGLKSEPATGSGILTEDRSICGAINREDVAELVVKALFSDKSDMKVAYRSIFCAVKSKYALLSASEQPWRGWLQRPE